MVGTFTSGASAVVSDAGVVGPSVAFAATGLASVAVNAIRFGASQRVSRCGSTKPQIDAKDPRAEIQGLSCAGREGRNGTYGRGVLCGQLVRQRVACSHVPGAAGGRVQTRPVPNCLGHRFSGEIPATTAAPSSVQPPVRRRERTRAPSLRDCFMLHRCVPASSHVARVSKSRSRRGAMPDKSAVAGEYYRAAVLSSISIAEQLYCSGSYCQSLA
jgi:hypothetical protein